MLRWIVFTAFAALCADVCAQRPAQPVAAALVTQPNGMNIRMPLKRPASRRNGLTLNVDTRWANNYGYRPVEIVVSSRQPTTADHLITVQLHSGWGANVSAEQDLEIPLGSKTAATIITLPIYERASNYFWWDVWVDGIKDDDLSLDNTKSLQILGGAPASTSSLTILAPSPSQPDRSLVSTSSFDYEVLSVKIGGLPRRWIDYTCVDVVALSTADLKLLQQTNPAALEAMERWVRTGGHLWVSDVGDELEELPQVSKTLGLADALTLPGVDAGANESNVKAKADSATPVRPAETGWRAARFRRGYPGGQVKTFMDIRTGRSRAVRDPDVIAVLDRDSNFVTTSQQFDAGDETAERSWPQDSRRLFVEQHLGLGMVRAFRGTDEADLFPQQAPAGNADAAANAGSSELIPRAIAAALRGTRPWEVRHGLVPDGGNPEFAKMLVPGVGLAPVTEFQILITLFVLVIGPVNYWLLKRFKRLQLLVLTVPLAAAAMTAALFAYAIMLDGFAATVRARSFTTLDQRTGEAACWAQLSYYTGLAPGQGLTMPADVVVYPILPSWSTESGRTTTRLVRWENDEMKLTRGWLNSRTPTQYLTLRARKSPNRLAVVAGHGKVRVTNQLGTEIEKLLLIDDAGNIFSGEKLDNEATTFLQAISRDDAAKRFGQLVRDNQPVAPAALAGSDRDFAPMRSRSAGRMYGRFTPPSSSGELTENFANLALTDLAGLNGRAALDLPPRSYVAVTAIGPEVVIGIPNAEEEASFHVIVGRW